MGSVCKSFSLFLIIIVAVSIPIIVKASIDQTPSSSPVTASTPSAPQFIVKFVNSSYEIQQSPFISLQSTLNVAETASAGSGPSITANVHPTQIYINQSVTVTGQIQPATPNGTILVAFVKPNLTWIDLYTPVNSTTGTFKLSYTLDACGVWTIYAMQGTKYETLLVNVISLPNSTTSPITNPLSSTGPTPSITVIAAALAIIVGGAVAVAKFVKNKQRNITSARIYVQIAALFFTFLGVFVAVNGSLALPFSTAQNNYLIGTNIAGAQFPDGLSVPTFGCYYASGRTVTCALWEIQAYIFPFWNSGHAWGEVYLLTGLERLAIVFGLVMLMSLILGRIFCGWVCPFGLYIDFISRVRKTLKVPHKKLSEETSQKLKQVRYIIFAAAVLVSFVLGSAAITGTALLPGTQLLIWPKSWIAPAGTAYTYFPYPFCEVCPMKPLCVMLLSILGPMEHSQIFSTTTGQFFQLGYYVTSLNLLSLALVTVAAFVFRRAWCRICPLGGLIAVFSTYRPFKYISVIRLKKTETKCTKCGVCKRVCPTEVNKVYKEKSGTVNDAACIMCLRCVEMCPEKSCLKVNVAGKTVFESRNWLE